jgi:hypothetical protein
MHWAEVLAIIGANIAMISWLKSDMKTFESRIDSKLDKWHDDIQKEMKDFHGRLEKQDAELKAHIMHCNDDRNRGK